MPKGWLKLGLVTVLWGTLSFASSANSANSANSECYAAYEQGFRRSTGQNDPQAIITDYHRCLALEKSRQQQQAATQEFRSQHAGRHGGGFAPVDETPEVQAIPKTASRGVAPQVELRVPLSFPPRQEIKENRAAADPCTGSRYPYFGANGKVTCNAANPSAVVAVNEFRADRENQMRGFLSEIARKERR